MELMNPQEYTQKKVLEFGFKDTEINRLVADIETLDIEKVYARAEQLYVFCEGKLLADKIADGDKHETLYPDSGKAQQLLGFLAPFVTSPPAVSKRATARQSLIDSGFGGMLRFYR